MRAARRTASLRGEGDTDSSGNRLDLRTGACGRGAVSGFFIFEVSGAPTVFHAVSVLALVLVSAGVALPTLLREWRTDWYVWNLRAMSDSYLTLVITGVAQFFDSLPLGHPALNAIVFLQLPLLVSIWLLEFRSVPRWRVRFAGGG